ncbi:DUF2267 domain-containing protein [Halopiger goleimassiliensis]|uniref:DUF2267 domain-containing protein n=1 Tax=Halopiger goleimassiliensis TaxID=1293048 RepID=UPI000677CFCE|nr:DUF2267 domain-containing protein [Halopiger goleimassiliensis]
MDQSEFHDRVTRSGPVDDAEPITEATLEALGEALSAGQAEAVATHLPSTYADALSPDEDAESESLSREEFLERVDGRLEAEGADDEEIQSQAEAVAEVLQESIPRSEQRGLRSQCPTTSRRCLPDRSSEVWSSCAVGHRSSRRSGAGRRM